MRRVYEEFANSPIALICQVGTFLIAVVSLLLARANYTPGSNTFAALAEPAAAIAAQRIDLTGILLLFSTFCATALFSALLTCLCVRARFWPGIICSPIFSIVAMFFTFLVAVISGRLVDEIYHVVFWGFFTIHFGINVESIIAWIDAHEFKGVFYEEEEEKKRQAKIVFPSFFMGIWGLLVFSGSQQLLVLLK